MRFTDTEVRSLLAVFDAILPAGADERLPFGASDVPLDAFLHELEATAPGQFLWGLRACAWLVHVSPPFVLGRLATFASLSVEERQRLLDRMAESPLYLVREMPLLFKTVACLGFCGLPEVQRRVGFTLTDAEAPPWARVSGTP